MVSEKKENNTQLTETKVEEKTPKNEKKDKNDKKEEDEDLVRNKTKNLMTKCIS
jgi:hypothetical protein